MAGDEIGPPVRRQAPRLMHRTRAGHDRRAQPSDPRVELSAGNRYPTPPPACPPDRDVPAADELVHADRDTQASGAFTRADQQSSRRIEALVA
jgi:hypothetical protein